MWFQKRNLKLKFNQVRGITRTLIKEKTQNKTSSNYLQSQSMKYVKFTTRLVKILNNKPS